jgi:hypothetical protein
VARGGRSKPSEPLRAVVLTHAEPHKHVIAFWWSSYRAWNSRSARASIAAWAACFLALSFFATYARNV